MGNNEVSSLHNSKETIEDHTKIDLSRTRSFKKSRSQSQVEGPTSAEVSPRLRRHVHPDNTNDSTEFVFHTHIEAECTSK